MLHNAKQRRELRRASLRSELIAAAHKLVQEEGYDALTIRKLAQRVGLAPMSVYSYFADKQDILYALAEDAFEALAQRIEQHQSDDPLEALRAVMVEYAAFGLGNPDEYRIVAMTEHVTPAEKLEAGQPQERNPAMELLIGRVEACVKAGKLSGDARAIATMLWAVGHGTIALLITFPHYQFGEAKVFAERMYDLTLAGLTAQHIAPLSDEPATC
ncbi:TetR family transcriptional regulator [Mesorhizobium sp. Root157]|uniref:TetR/AcrR family transcriptional regulator n=1 Tax=Mesorhizobium sp. Root157 TaxID=1736477 RepID=UPI0006FC824B|nr:TetR/AcrR family transcriptional regulator [Mesorhizobium sp. Root157]KQZ97800.1 TetR family transcriptional regulator [Mesorhizobium sp. Root157]